MRINVDWNDERMLGNLFRWMTKAGMAPAFGSRPIGWYQTHMAKAVEVLEHVLEDKGFPPDSDLIVRGGNVYAGKDLLAVASDVYKKADAMSRKGSRLEREWTID